MPNQIERAKRIKTRLEQKWLEMDEVSAVGIGLVDGSEIGIIISVTDHNSRIRNQIPDRIEGVRVKVEVTGEFRAQ